jgi:hypothetical protein
MQVRPEEEYLLEQQETGSLDIGIFTQVLHIQVTGLRITVEPMTQTDELCVKQVEALVGLVQTVLIELPSQITLLECQQISQSICKVPERRLAICLTGQSPNS